MHAALIIIAQNGYQDTELEGTRTGLLEANFEITLCSKEEGTCTGKFGGREEATVAMRDADPSQFDRIAFIGGPGAGVLRDDPEAKDLAKRTAASGKKWGAICIAPTILASAGALKGKRATVWNKNDQEGAYLENHGAIYVPEHVVIDGNLVTADGPEAAEEFGKALASM